MAIDTSAISNVGEFYSDHYLDAILDKDVKSHIKAWEESEGNGYVAPHKRLSGLSSAYFKLKSKLSNVVDNDERFKLTHELNVLITEALGYEYKSGGYELADDDMLIPILSSSSKDGNPYLWIVETYWDLSEDARFLDQYLLDVQKPENTDEYEMPSEPWENIPGIIFKKDEPPRWLILLSGGRAMLIERHKWGQGQYLEFDLDEIMSRKNVDNFKAVAVLLSKEAVVPEDSNSLHDTLDDSSHKHAYSVSSDLKYGLRRAVELLANEYVYYIQTEKNGRGLNNPNLDNQLTTECLAYMYRLLFLLYAEARSGDLSLLPMNSDEYRRGYSMESLRDLEQVKLNTEKAQNGYFLHESLTKLFGLINDGHSPAQIVLQTEKTVEFEPTQSGMFGTGEVAQGRLKMAPETQTKVDKRYTDYEFTIEALGSPLFDSDKTPLLSKAKFRNVVLQEIIQLLSLSKQGRRRHSGRGRISYAQLGINQLGAVYEGLLSYTGFFANETLYEVKKADDKSEDENRQAYFIPESEVEKYHEDEFVKLPDPNHPTAPPKRVKYEKGTFIYRLAGRDREKSASYYTPEVLTKSVVKYSLKELLKDKTADEILHLTVCEPAMGSGAFLNEAVNQLADAYLQAKQKELEQDISPGEYQDELQKVKAHIATHNCYGVDLNPTAVDLAKVSMWLNIIYKHSKTPWFNLRLSSGNSLIGARLQVFKEADLKAKRGRGVENYLDRVPERIDLNIGRQDDEIYHFFIPDVGMAGFDKDKVIKGLLPDEVQKIKDWRRPFTEEFTDAQIRTLKRLSNKVDELFTSHLADRERLLKTTDDAIPVWPATGKAEGLSIKAKELQEQDLYRATSAYRKLKLVMDYWCALWFWPIEKAGDLPTRDQFIRDCELILEGKTSGIGQVSDQMGLYLKTGEKREKAEAENIDEFGIDDIINESIRLKIVRDIITTTPFMHWELQYYEIFKNNGGFDLIVGNPPWSRARIEIKDILSEFKPWLGIRGLNTKEFNESLLDEIESSGKHKNVIILTIANIIGYRNHLSSKYFPISRTVVTNLYKCFLERSSIMIRNNGVFTFLHDSGINDESGGEYFRTWYLKHLIFTAKFINQLNHFPEEALGHAGQFSISILGLERNEIDYFGMTSVLHPNTIDMSFKDLEGIKKIPPLKTKKGWVTEGHKNRLVRYNNKSINIFEKTFYRSGNPNGNPITLLYTEQFLQIIEKISKLPSLSSKVKTSHARAIFDENSSIKSGLLQKQTVIPKKLENFIISAPHFYVGYPLFKQPNENCRSKGDYSVLNLNKLKEDYIPRSLFSIGNNELFSEIINSDECKTNIRNYRLGWRTWVSPNNERTLITTILPPKVLNIYPVHSMVIENHSDLLFLTGLTYSILYDFLIRLGDKDHVWSDDILSLPFPNLIDGMKNSIIKKVLKLICINNYYDDLWSNIYPENPSWIKNNRYLSNRKRRKLLIDIDVLVGLALGLNISDLLLIFRLEFPTLKNNEQDTWYDQKGQIVFTINKGLPGIGFSRPEWNDIKDMKTGTVERKIMDDTIPGGPIERTITYEAPFDRCDREADYRIAWAEFEKRLGKA
ncbi:MAG: N-6 DNA methylase [Candidatus Brocadiales bacterium]|nr:N-6 DNA methylase [Candidatus Brocadiales bacterium]